MSDDSKRTDRAGGRQGFASMDGARQRAIASQGGSSVPAEKRSFSQDRTLAAEAGRKGGQRVAAADRSFSQDRELAAQAGRKGGQSVAAQDRSFSRNRSLASEAGRKGGQASHARGRAPTSDTAARDPAMAGE
jgi:hypothetical protein